MTDPVILYWVANWNLSRAQAARLLGGAGVVDMLDCTHANRHSQAVLDELYRVQVVAGYDTGTPDIRWTPEDWHLPYNVRAEVHVDQSDSDIPALAEVKHAEDIEAGAKRIGVAVEVARQRHARRLDTILYCSQAVLGELETAIREAGLPAGEIIGYQYGNHPEFDLSVVIFDRLPKPLVHLTPAPPAPAEPSAPWVAANIHIGDDSYNGTVRKVKP